MNTNCATSPVAARRSHLFLILASACVLTACQKQDTVLTTTERLKAVEQKQQTEPEFYVPRKVVDYMSDLKSLKDNTPKTATPATVPDPVAIAKPGDAKPAPAETKAATSPAPAPLAPPVQVAAAPSAPAANVVASAAPTARPTPPKDVAAAVTVISREQPDFPRDAVRAGVESGLVRARITINAAGGVSNVDIVEAKPGRVFDRAVTQALSRWKFNPGAEGRTYETEVNFKQ